MLGWIITLNVLTVAGIAAGALLWRMPDASRHVIAWLAWCARVLGWIVCGIAIFALAALVAGIGINLLVGGATIVVLAMVVNRRAQVRRDALVELLAVSAEHGVPIEKVLTAFASECGGSYGQKINRLVAHLKAGMPLADALALVRGLVRPQAICAARLGTATGKLGPALRDVVAIRNARGPLWNQLIGRGWLLFWPTLGLLALSVFWGYFIFPQMSRVWDDFGVPGPIAAEWLGNIVRDSPAGLVAVLLLAIAVLGSMWLLLVYIGWVPLMLPMVTHWMKLDTTPILRDLALICESEMPLAQGLHGLGQVYPAEGVRRRLRQVASAVDAGHPWPQALAETSLITYADADVLNSAIKLGHVPWALRATADANERRFTYRALVALQIAFPIALVALATIVLVVALGAFAPIAEVIHYLVESY